MTMTENRRSVRIAVLGTDSRQKELAQELKLRFHPGAVIHADAPEQLTAPADAIVLPIKGIDSPDDAVRRWLGEIDVKTRLLVGKTTATFMDVCKNRSIEVISYLEQPNFKIANAVPTAEGAIKLYMEQSNQTVSESRMLVLGFGHCGKALALRLKALGADVSVFARSYEDRVYGKSLGIDMRDYQQLHKLTRQRTCIFNTVPHLILDASILNNMPKSSLIIDLASMPGGTDFQLCEQLDLNAIHALSLPGKYFPRTAGKILADTVVTIIKGED